MLENKKKKKETKTKQKCLSEVNKPIRTYTHTSGAKWKIRAQKCAYWNRPIYILHKQTKKKKKQKQKQKKYYEENRCVKKRRNSIKNNNNQTKPSPSLAKTKTEKQNELIELNFFL